MRQWGRWWATEEGLRHILLEAENGWQRGVWENFGGRKFEKYERTSCRSSSQRVRMEARGCESLRGEGKQERERKKNVRLKHLWEEDASDIWKETLRPIRYSMIKIACRKEFLIEYSEREKKNVRDKDLIYSNRKYLL